MHIYSLLETGQIKKTKDQKYMVSCRFNCWHARQRFNAWAKTEDMSLSTFVILDSGLADIMSPSPVGGVYKWFEKGRPDLAYIGEAAVLAKRKQDHSTLDPTTCEFTIWVQQRGGEMLFETLEAGWFNKRERLAREKFYIEKFITEGGLLVNKEYKMWTPPWRSQL